MLAWVVRLDRSMWKFDSDLWLNVKNLHLYRAISLEHDKKILDIRYKIKNYDNKVKYKAKDKSYKKIKRYLIICLENIIFGRIFFWD